MAYYIRHTCTAHLYMLHSLLCCARITCELLVLPEIINLSLLRQLQRLKYCVTARKDRYLLRRAERTTILWAKFCSPRQNNQERNSSSCYKGCNIQLQLSYGFSTTLLMVLRLSDEIVSMFRVNFNGICTWFFSIELNKVTVSMKINKLR